ncbi:MAG TPA: MFS transporter, partial [Pseudonocardiaceae bacterium]|nr:MFS transporter [Pseudonocardiaceae bacterium]
DLPAFRLTHDDHSTRRGHEPSLRKVADGGSARCSGSGGSVAQRDGGGAVSGTADYSVWAPLRQRAFRWLWLGVLIGWIGIWMQVVGAQWLLVDAPNAAALVSLVQAANSLPVMLLALPGGVLADSFDRRWLLFTVQAYVFVLAILLAVLTAAGQTPPALLLAFTFALGARVAVQLPAWGASMPELVPRTQLREASRLDLAAVNVSRAVGPALAGLVIAHLGGVAIVFALNAFSVVFLAIALLFWRRPQPGLDSQRERFVPALRAGGRYVWHEPVVRRILLRTIIVAAPAMALWALLPLVASDRLGVGADGYGAMFGALGLGAILGALVLGRATDRLSANGTLFGAGVLYAAALAVLVLVPNFPAALVALVAAGLAWMAATSTLQAELQLVLPAWVRARGFAIYTVVFGGAQAAGALLWGLIADQAGVQPTVLLAAVVMLAGAVAGMFWRLPETGHIDPEPAVYWPDARLSFDPEPHAGPVLVAVHYTVTPQRQAAFLQAMDHLRRSRRRTGATRWELYRDGELPDRFVEMFTVASWAEHLRQHEGRLTGSDQEVEEAALAFSDPPARGEHLLPP